MECGEGRREIGIERKKEREGRSKEGGKQMEGGVQEGE